MITYVHRFFEDYAGVVYAFEHAGDCIPMHKHPKELEHNVQLLKGSVRVNGHIMRHENELYDFDSSLPHEIVALLPDTKILNCYNIGIPTGYLQLPKACLEGVIDAVGSITYTEDPQGDCGGDRREPDQRNVGESVPGAGRQDPSSAKGPDHTPTIVATAGDFGERQGDGAKDAPRATAADGVPTKVRVGDARDRGPRHIDAAAQVTRENIERLLIRVSETMEDIQANTEGGRQQISRTSDAVARKLRECKEVLDEIKALLTRE